MKRGYEAHILGEAPHHFQDGVEALKELKVDLACCCCCCAVSLWVGRGIVGVHGCK